MSMAKITFDPCYKNMHILADDRLGCYEDILDSIYDIFEDMLSRHNKVWFMRFDVTFPDDRQYPLDNVLFKKFISGFVKNLSRATLDPMYFWVAEKRRSHNHHYHCIMFLNGNKTQSSYRHLRLAETLWARTLDLPDDMAEGLIDYCNDYRGGIMIRRYEPDYMDKYQQAFEWASYLAKVNSKLRVEGVRSYGGSKLN